ncbi:hypothetical protein HW555_002671 [Spodoptera exigua]|uniref:Uncharacterized protein n=1 Tax=Spodoptera exigua TaxID=7107 RepID=A0A835GQ95_SPOEX|nr:hypothetical protein HW555_002671 [Spodoptera exigua]
MECCYQPDCGEYTVTPMLVAPSCTPNYCVEEAAYIPCLPRCQKPVYYCCTKEVPKRECCPLPSQPVCCRPQSTPPQHVQCPPPQEACDSCCTQPPQPPPCKPPKTKYIIPCYRYEDGRIERYVPTRYGRLPMSAYRRNGMQDQIHGYRGAIRYLCTGEGPRGQYCVHTSVEPMNRLFPKVRRLPVSAFKRNGMQDQEHSKLLGTANFLVRCPRDVSIECDVLVNPVKVADPVKVPSCSKSPLGCAFLKKKPIEVSLEDILDE